MRLENTVNKEIVCISGGVYVPDPGSTYQKNTAKCYIRFISG